MLRILFDDFDQKIQNIHDDMDLHHSYIKKACMYLWTQWKKDFYLNIQKNIYLQIEMILNHNTTILNARFWLPTLPHYHSAWQWSGFEQNDSEARRWSYPDGDVIEMMMSYHFSSVRELLYQHKIFDLNLILSKLFKNQEVYIIMKT